MFIGAISHRSNWGMSPQPLPEKGTALEGDAVTPEAAKEGAEKVSNECPDGGFLAWTQVAGVSSSYGLDILSLSHWESHDTSFRSSGLLLTSKICTSDVSIVPNPWLNTEMLSQTSHTGVLHIFQHMGDCK